MSNHLAIATVTATLKAVLQTALNNDVPSVSGAKVSSLRVNAQDLPSTGINIFLYQITPNPAARNVDAPTRRADGQLIQRPRAGIDLHYLLSFYGEDLDYEPQILLASAVRALHANPVLDRDAINTAVAADPTLTGSDLADAPDLVRFSPVGLSLEELSKLWSVFLQTSYTLSIAYQASLVFLDAPVAEPPRPLPVRAATVLAVPLRRPVLERVLSKATAASPAVERQPILAGYTLVLAGKDLGSEIVLVGPPPPPPRVPPAPLFPGTSPSALPTVLLDGVGQVADGATTTEITAKLPNTLRVGAHTVRAVYHVPLGSTGQPHVGAETNTLVFVLQPSIAVNKVLGGLEITFTPPIKKTQNLALVLDQIDAAPGTTAHAYRIEAPARTNPEDTVITFSTTGVAAGKYLLRAWVDGIESPVDFVAKSPSVTLP